MPNSNITTGQALIGATLTDLGMEYLLEEHNLYDNSTIAFIGGEVVNNGILSNSFLPTLINKISVTIIDSKIYENPFKEFGKGDMPDGVGIEDLYVNPITPIDYQSGYNVNIDGNVTGYADQFALFNPDVKALYYTLNSTKVFPLTVKEQELRTAFTNWDTFQKFVDKIVTTLKNSVELYEFEKTKWLLGSALEKEHPPLKFIECLPYNDIEFSTDYVERCRNLAIQFKFFNSKNNNWADYVSSLTDIDDKYINKSPVKTFTKTEDLRLIQLADVTTKVTVEVLATAFNIDKTDFIGKVHDLDDWTTVAITDYPDNPTVNVKYHTSYRFTNDKQLKDVETATLGCYDYLGEDGKHHHREVYGILCDKHFVQIWDTLNTMKKVDNNLSLYTNYFKHLWQTYALCGFCNAVALYSDVIIDD